MKTFSLIFIPTFVLICLYLCDPKGFRRMVRLAATWLANGIFNSLLFLIAMFLFTIYLLLHYARKAYNAIIDRLYSYESGLRLTPDEEEELNRSVIQDEHLFI